METLRRIRTMRGMNQVDLAEASGVAQNTISEIELGKRRARPGTLKKLAGALGVEISDLLGEETDRPLGEASQPSLEDAARSETDQEALAVLFRGLARRGERIVEQSITHGASKYLSRDAAEFQRDGMMLERLRRGAVGPTMYGHGTGELAEAVDEYAKAAQKIQDLLAQDVDYPEMARAAGAFRQSPELKELSTEELKEMAHEEAQFAKPQTREEMVRGHEEDKKAQLREAHRRTMAFSLIAEINEVLEERGARWPTDLAIKQYNEVMGSSEGTPQQSHEAHQGRETA